MSYALLLAGGKSTRMGQDKGKLVIDGETLLQRAWNLLKHSDVDHILVSGAVVGVASVPDLIPDCGPLGGIYSSLDYIQKNHQLDNSRLLIIPVDMPNLNSAALSKVLQAAVDSQCCHYQGEVFPCVMRASKSLYAYLHEAFVESTALGGKRSMKGLMRHFDAKVISAENLAKKTFLNLNKPEDWAVLQGAV